MKLKYIINPKTINMTTEEKRTLRDHLLSCIEKESLHTREVARALNLKPCYITWVKNEKFWDSMSRASWNRLEEWYLTREAIKLFTIPEGEQPVEIKGENPEERPREQGVSEHSPENLLPEAGTTRLKRKYTRHDPGKGESVKIVLQKEEIEQLNRRIDLLIEDKNKKDKLLQYFIDGHGKFAAVVEDLAKKVFVIEDESLAAMRQEIKDLQEGIGHLVTLAKKEDKPTVILFQKNIYKP
jgi:hypothetical protein